MRKKATAAGIGMILISSLVYQSWPKPSILITNALLAGDIPSPDPVAAATLDLIDFAPAVGESAPTATAGPTRATWIEHQIHRGETLAGIFKRYDLGTDTLHDLLHSDDRLQKDLTRLYRGDTVKILMDEQGQLEKLIYQPELTQTIAVTQNEDGFDIERIFKEPQRTLKQAGRIIQDSIYADAKQAGLSDKLITQLTEIFGWDIDFARSIQPADQFAVLYEQQHVNGKLIGEGPIVAAEIITQGKTYRALRFTLPDGSSDYYTPEGEALHKAFLRMPVESARITSRFNLHRHHPILHRIRAHKGVDYAAPIGTPVRATGDGKIIFRGRKGGYGRVIILQHGRNFSTLYAHLHRFNPRFGLGSQVRQGDIIAYVGQSGLATGPHLHYEFRVDGIHRDPLSAPLLQGRAIPKPLLSAFKLQAAPLLAALEQYRRTVLVQAETGAK